MSRVRLVPAALAVLGCLAGTAACSAPAATVLMTMPADRYGMPTVLGPLSGSGNKTLTVTVRSAMSVQLGCLGNGKDLAWVRSSFATFAVPCQKPGDQSFGGAYASAQSIERDKLTPGQRVTVRITAPADDTWQVWITGGRPVAAAQT